MRKLVLNRLLAVVGALLSFAAIGLTAAEPAPAKGDSVRTHDKLQVLYDFKSADGPFVKDGSAAGEPLNLKIADEKSAQVTAEGLKVTGNTLIRTEQPPARLIKAIKESGAITIEAWVHPANTTQIGPARIVTLSRNPLERNFTLGQDGDKIEARLRTADTNTNGIPALVTKEKVLPAEMTHIVYTRAADGRAVIYINGKPAAEGKVTGSLANWDGGYELGLANELSGDRPWQGMIRLVAIYSRDLASKEVEQNFRAGFAQPGKELPTPTKVSSALFEKRIATIFSKHCLECHDAVTKKGNLDLSHKATAIAGGEHGPAFVPGKSADSFLWKRVQTNEMPHKRQPLSDNEKALLRQWLDEGAVWSLDVIDPAVYAQGGGANKIFVQRLTVPEYIETVRRTLGVDVTKEARKVLPRDLRADGFSNTAYNLNVDLGHVEAYAKLAEIIAGRINLKDLATKYTASRELTDENVTKVIEPVGRRLLRGPLTKEELTVYCGISTTVASSGGNLDDALRYILEAMLQSPRFLYRIEYQRGDGSKQPINHYELASRLSYILWGGPPDEELLQAADKKALDRAVKSQVERMLKDRRAIDHSLLFATEWLDLDRLDTQRPSPQKFPHWETELAGDMRRETLAFFEEIAWKQNRPLQDLLTARLTFVTSRLAKHYGLPMDNKNSSAGDSQRYDLSAVPGRGGLLTQGSVLTIGGDDASTVTRGLFVMHELLRGVVRDPPPCVDTTPVPTKPGLTRRAIAESRLANQSCAGCHVKFEPLSFALEKFDGLGSFHESDEHGNKLRDDGQILFPGDDKPLPYQSTLEYLDLLAKSDRVRESLTWKVTQFALGRPLDAKDAPVVAEIHRTAQKAGGTYANLLTAIVLSELVQNRRVEP